MEPSIGWRMSLIRLLNFGDPITFLIKGRWIAMTTAQRSIICAILFTFLSHAAYAAPPTGWKAHELPPTEEQRWIETVKNHKTADGATVVEVLR
jgi:hypothetical protein